jgi:hypothetical protein
MSSFSDCQAELSALSNMSNLDELEKYGKIRVVRFVPDSLSGYYELLCTVKRTSIIAHLYCKFWNPKEPCQVHIDTFLQLIHESPELQQELNAFVASKASEVELLKDMAIWQSRARAL